MKKTSEIFKEHLKNFEAEFEELKNKASQVIDKINLTNKLIKLDEPKWSYEEIVFIKPVIKETPKTKAPAKPAKKKRKTKKKAKQKPAPETVSVNEHVAAN